ncbi:isoprenoid synthase domain-containing protein [Xylogone sp. PMI_703]|nr:isoprenoid synthase domain-containing protein [Xylogone sp. PMI_703]
MTSSKAFDFEIQPYKIPPSLFEHRYHHVSQEAIEANIISYMEKNWDFKSEKQKRSIFSVDFAKTTRLIYSFTFDDRLDYINRLHYVALLIDDELSPEEMASYCIRLAQVVRGEVAPDNTACIEKILYETLEMMRPFDEEITQDVVEGFIIVLQNQTNSERFKIKHLDRYLPYRAVDVGQQFYTALVRFGAGLHLTPAERELALPLEIKAFEHVGIINDIYSWNKEWKAYQAHPCDATQPFSSVRIISQETGMPHPACKRLMYMFCREVEIAFKEYINDLRGKGSTMPLRLEVETYFKALEFFAAGNEVWSQSTPRYNRV